MLAKILVHVYMHDKTIHIKSFINFILTSFMMLTFFDNSRALITFSHVVTPHFKNLRYSAILQEFNPFPSLSILISYNVFSDSYSITIRTEYHHTVS